MNLPTLGFWLNLLIATLLVGLVSELFLLLGRRARLRQTALRLAFVAMTLTPVSAWWCWTSSALWQMKSPSASFQAVTPAKQQPEAADDEAMRMPSIGAQVESQGIPAVLSEAEIETATKPDRWTWESIILTVWLCGAGLAAACWLYQCFAVRRLRMQLARVDAFDLQAEVAGAAEFLKMRWCPPLYDYSGPPITLGPFSPALALPVTFMRQLSPCDRQAILVHELAHFANRHHGWSYVRSWVRILFWWQPLVYRLSHQAAECDEWVCDEAVCARQGTGVHLAELLIMLAERQQLAAGGLGFIRRSGFERRVQHILEMEKPMRQQRTMALLFSIGFVALAWVNTTLGVGKPTPVQQADEKKLQSATRGGTLRVQTFRGGQQTETQSDEGDEEASDKKLPSITYRGSRSSNTWIATKSGAKVAVGKGIEFQGKKIYLSLTWNLLVHDPKANKTVWDRSVSAYWNKVSVEKFKNLAGKEVWTVALRSTRNPKQVERYEFDSGKKLPGKKDVPSGKAIKLRKVWSGNDAGSPKKTVKLIDNMADWKTIRGPLFDGTKNGPSEQEKIDFGKEVVLVISLGDQFNCSGIRLKSAYLDAKRLLIRQQHLWYQSIEIAGAPARKPDRPYGVFVLPRSASKIIVERNRQNLIGAPPKWRQEFEFELGK